MSYARASTIVRSVSASCEHHNALYSTGDITPTPRSWPSRLEKPNWRLCTITGTVPATKEPSVHHPAPSPHKYCAIGVATPATGRPEVACTAKPLCHTLQCYITRMDFWRSLEQRWRYRALREPGLQLRTGNYHSICSKHKKGLHGSWKARSGPHPSTRSRVTIAPRIIHRNAIGVCKTSMALWRG